MPKITRKCILALLSIVLLVQPSHSSESYQNFHAAIYARVYEVQQMKDLNWLKERFEVMSRYIKVDKVYLETHRDMVVADEETITGAKQFFASRGVKTSGGITITVNERNRFQTFCYTNPDHRKKLKEIVEYTARLFDEVILDDFFFTNCKCELCIKAKGDKSWTEFRLALLDAAARSLVVNPARAVNPDVTMIIKYPNWYEHFQGLGYNLETEPPIFDKLYTGTETRDAVRSQQHLQPYQSYLIFRYLENIKPGANAGGWVDTGGMQYLDRYAEQLWLTLFAKAPEMTLFDFRQMQRPIQESLRAPWQGSQTSFDFDAMIAPVRKEDGTWPQETTIALAAGYALDQVDHVLGLLGNPLGLKSYKPYHSTGEDFLHNYLGMIGIPMDLVPEFPTDARMIFLAESAKFDKGIVEKIKTQLMDGKSVVITSGLLRALQGKGIEDIVELEYTNRKALVKDFVVGWGGPTQSREEIVIPQIQYLTNDSWELISGMDAGIGWPILHQADYGNGILYVLTIPENFADLYNLPPEVLGRIREVLSGDLDVRIEGPSQVALFVYDNDTFIVESFLPEQTDIRIVVDSRFSKLRNSVSGEQLSGE
ncbi:hypothetical protein A2V82_06930, partial [candidate division KSB1 bacterium RBG_16_48_16]